MPKLPPPILAERLKAELEDCREHTRHYLTASDESFTRFPVEVSVTMMSTPAPMLQGSVDDEKIRIRHKYQHKMLIVITDEYPYAKPTVRWKSEIFHPNIMLPEDGGFVCTKLLDDWRYDSTLLSFLKGVETLLVSPNPENPYGTATCIAAAVHFRDHPYRPPDIIADTPRRTGIAIIEDASDDADGTDAGAEGNETRGD